MNVLFLKDPYTYPTFTNIEGNIGKTDVVILVTTTKKRKYCDIKALTKSRPIFIYSVTNSKLYPCGYHGYDKNYFILYANEDDSENISNKIKEMLRTHFHNFGRRTLTVAFNTIPPLIAVRNVSGDVHVEGIEYELLTVISKKLNFNFNLKQFFHSDGVSAKYKALTELSQEEVDLAIGGVTLTDERTRKFECMWSHQYDNYIVIFLTDTNNLRHASEILWDKLFKTPYIPIMFLGACIIAFVAKMSTRLFKDKDKHLGEYMWVLYGISTNEAFAFLTNYKKIRYRSPVKILIASWIILSVITDVYFDAVLSTSFIHRKKEDNINTLIAKGYEFVVHPADYIFFKQWCGQSLLPLCQIILRRAKVSENFCRTLEEPMHAIIVGDMPVTFILDTVYNFSKKFPPTHDFFKLKSSKCTFMSSKNLKVAISTVNIGSGMLTFLFPKNTPYENAFSKVVLRLQGGGLIEHWGQNEKRIRSRYLDATHFKRKHQKAVAIDLNRITVAFYVLLGGLFSSLLVFLVEKRRYCIEKGVDCGA